jgi:hypothetical protein
MVRIITVTIVSATTVRSVSWCTNIIQEFGCETGLYPLFWQWQLSRIRDGTSKKLTHEGSVFMNESY